MRESGTRTVRLDVDLVVLCGIKESRYYKAKIEYTEMVYVHLMRRAPGEGRDRTLRNPTVYLAQIVTIASRFGRFDGHSEWVLQRAIEIDDNRCRWNSENRDECQTRQHTLQR